MRQYKQKLAMASEHLLNQIGEQGSQVQQNIKSLDYQQEMLLRGDQKNANDFALMKREFLENEQRKQEEKIKLKKQMKLKVASKKQTTTDLATVLSSGYDDGKSQASLKSPFESSDLTSPLTSIRTKSGLLNTLTLTANKLEQAAILQK